LANNQSGTGEVPRLGCVRAGSAALSSAVCKNRYLRFEEMKTSNGVTECEKDDAKTSTAIVTPLARKEGDVGSWLCNEGN
jgi:hypothetical protein